MEHNMNKVERIAAMMNEIDNCLDDYVPTILVSAMAEKYNLEYRDALYHYNKAFKITACLPIQ